MNLLRPRRRFVAILAGAALVVASALAVAGLASGGSGTATTVSGAPAAGRTAVVTRRSLDSTVDADATVGYGDRRTISGTGGGTITRLPEAGAVIGPDQPLYDVDGHPGPILLAGALPMWRVLDPVTAVDDGADVAQVEAALQALGYFPGGLAPDEHYSSATTAAVERWQRAHGLDDTGRIGPSDVVFSPGPIRVAQVTAALGAPASGEILSVTGTDRQVHVDLAAKYSQYAVAGSKVSIELPDRSTVPGTVTSVAATATVTAGQQGAPATTTVAVVITPDAPIEALDESPVTVAFTSDRVTDVLAVPIEAVVAVADGGYALEVVDATGSSRLVDVELGRFADGWVQVTGEIAAGDAVVTV